MTSINTKNVYADLIIREFISYFHGSIILTHPQGLSIYKKINIYLSLALGVNKNIENFVKN